MKFVRALVRPLVYLPALAAVVAAMVLAVVSSVPFERVQTAIDRWSSKGHAESFTPILFQAVTLKLRVGSLLLFAAAPLLFRYRRTVASTVLARMSDCLGFAAHLWSRALTACRRESAEHIALLVGIAVVGVLLRAVALSQPINYDEAFTFVTYVRRPLWVSLADYSYPNNHLLHTVLAHLTTQLFGIQLWSLRLPAFLAGCLLIPLSYVVSRIVWDGTTGLIAATLVATSEVLIAFSVCARGYTLIGAIFLMMLICADDLMRGERSAWTPYVILASLGFFAVPVFVYPYLAISTCLLLTAVLSGDGLGRMIRQVLYGSIATAVMVAILYLPVMVVSGLSSGVTYGFKTEPSAFAVLDGYGRFLGLSWLDFVRGMNPLLAAALMASAAFSMVSVPRRWINGLVLAIVFWSLCATALQQVVMPPRVWLFAVPLFLSIAAAGVVCALRRVSAWYRVSARMVERAAVAALVVPLCVYAWLSRPTQYTEVFGQDEIAMVKDVAQVAAYLKDGLQADDAVVSVFPTVDLLEYYFRLYRMPVESLKTRPPGTTRYLVVTNDAIGLSLDVVLAKAGLPAASRMFTQPVKRFEYDAIYAARAR